MDFKPWKDFVNNLNKLGIPLPMVRDPRTGTGSATLTLLIISSIIVIISLLNSFAKIFQGVDIANSLQFFLICFGGYLGRGFQTKAGSASASESTSEKEK